MRRREAAAALLAMSLAPRAFATAPRRMRTIGYLSGGGGGEDIAAYLAPLGHTLGEDLRFVVRGESRPDGELDKLAGELVRAAPDVLLGFYHHRVAALFAATKTIPIVAGVVPDPVGSGYARSLARPGGNLTGLSSGVPESFPIALGMMRALVPGLRHLAIVHPPDYREFTNLARVLEGECSRAGIATRRMPVTSADDLDAAFRAVADSVGSAAYLWPLFDFVEPAEIGAMALRHKVVAQSYTEVTVPHGVLLSCKLVWEPERRLARTAAILDKVLRGTSPAVIPIEVPDRVSLHVNRAAAAKLGLQVPESVMLRATKVIG